jgi:tetratricopeptide (TPR) repeat protein
MKNQMQSNPEIRENTVDIDEQLRRGLDFYGKDFVDEAIDCWKKVVEYDPDNETARDYLESAGYYLPGASKAEQFVEQGLQKFAECLFSEAVELWEQALEIDEDSRARKYLDELRITSKKPIAKNSIVARQVNFSDLDENGAQIIPGPACLNTEGVNKEEIIKLLKQKRYMAVLEQLYLAVEKSPDDEALKRSVKLLENRMTLEYANRIGSLDQIPELARPLEDMLSLDLSREEAYLLSLVDGTSNLDDILAISSLGAFKTYRYMLAFLDNDLVTLPV